MHELTISSGNIAAVAMTLVRVLFLVCLAPGLCLALDCPKVGGYRLEEGVSHLGDDLGGLLSISPQEAAQKCSSSAKCTGFVVQADGVTLKSVTSPVADAGTCMYSLEPALPSGVKRWARVQASCTAVSNSEWALYVLQEPYSTKSEDASAYEYDNKSIYANVWGGPPLTRLTFSSPSQCVQVETCISVTGKFYQQCPGGQTATAETNNRAPPSPQMFVQPGDRQSSIASSTTANSVVCPICEHVFLKESKRYIKRCCGGSKPKCCGQQCCKASSKCCGGSCCRASAKCCAGLLCCPSGQCCGFSCCNAGQKCCGFKCVSRLSACTV